MRTWSEVRNFASQKFRLTPASMATIYTVLFTTRLCSLVSTLEGIILACNRHETNFYKLFVLHLAQFFRFLTAIVD